MDRLSEESVTSLDSGPAAVAPSSSSPPPSEPWQLVDSFANDSPSSRPNLLPLVTIHGINSEGRWQEELEPIFAPHFRYVPLKYTAFRRWGFLKVVVEPRVLFSAAIILLFFVIVWRPSPLVTASLAVLVLLVAWLTAPIRRNAVIRELTAAFEAEIPTGELGAVICHSFGTFAWASLLRRPTVRCEHIVFAGAVVPRNMPERLMRGRAHPGFRSMRNEVGMKDLVVWTAGIMGKVRSQFGNAGLRGIIGLDAHVHTVTTPDVECSKCSGTASRPPWLVHNVQFRFYGHSDHFITPNHAVQFWLPFLWDIEPLEYQRWLERCDATTRCREAGQLGELARRARESLLSLDWQWAGGRDLIAFASHRYPGVAAMLQRPDVQLRFAEILSTLVVRARDGVLTHGGDPGRMRVVRALEPQVAVHYAIALLT